MLCGLPYVVFVWFALFVLCCGLFSVLCLDCVMSFDMVCLVFVVCFCCCRVLCAMRCDLFVCL